MALRSDKGPDWRYVVVLVVSVVAVWWGGARPVLAATTRYEESSWSFVGPTSGWPSASNSGGNAKQFFDKATLGFTVATGGTAVLQVYGPRDSGGGSGTWNLDGGAQTGTWSSNGSAGYQVLQMTTGTLTPGSHSITLTRTGGGSYGYLDYGDLVETADPTTTTTTVPPTTTTTGPPTTTTTAPPPTTTTTVPPGGVPPSLSDDPNALPVSSMLAMGGLVAGLVAGSTLTRMLRP